MAAGNGVRALCSTFISMLLARMLAPDDFGVYFLVVSMTLLGAGLAQFGTHQAIVKLIASNLARNDGQAVRKSLRAVALLALIGSGVVAGAYAFGGGQWVAAHLLQSNNVALLAGVTAFWMVMRHGQMLLAKAFRGFHDLRWAALFEGALPQCLTAIALCVVWLAVGQISLAGAVQVSLFASVLTLVCGVLLFWRQHWSQLPRARGVSMRPVLRLSAPLFVSSFSFLAMGEVHLWILAAVSVPEQVALYGAAFQLMRLVKMPLLLVNQVIPPMVAELFSQRQFNRIERLMRGTATVIAMPAALVLALMLFFSGDVLALVFGEFFRSGAVVLLIMAAGQMINVLTGSPGLLLAMSNQQRALMFSAFFGGLAGIGISVVLARDLGAAGVALGYSAGLALQNLAMAVIALRRLSIKTFPGIGQVRDIWFRLRDALARQAQDHVMLRWLDGLVRPLETVVYKAFGIRIIECFGDSQTNIFFHVNLAASVPGFCFRPSVVQDATPLGLANSKSQANVQQKFSGELIKVPPTRPLLFLLGEVDIGYLIWMKAARDGETVHDVLDQALRRYFSFLEKYLEKGYPLILMTVPLPAVRDSEMRAMEEARPGLTASQRDLTKLTLEFNARLRSWAAAHGVFLIDLDADLLDVETGLLREKYYKRRRIDNHLEPEPFAALIGRVLSQGSFLSWLEAGASKCK